MVQRPVLDRTSAGFARRRGADPPMRLARFTRDLRVAAACSADQVNQCLAGPHCFRLRPNRHAVGMLVVVSGHFIG